MSENFNPYLGDARLLTRIRDIDAFNTRVKTCLRNGNVIFLAQLLTRTEGNLLEIGNFGRRSLKQVKDYLETLPTEGRPFMLGSLYMDSENLSTPDAIREYFKIEESNGDINAKLEQGFCADNFQAVSSIMPFEGTVDMRFKVCDAFAEAVRGGDITFMLAGNPTGIDSDANCPMANNARQVAEAIEGYECYFDPERGELNVSFNATDVHSIVGRDLQQELADACFNLMPKP